jgi:MraZ protein
MPVPLNGVRFVQVGEFFSGAVLNAVDAKGRVSLPSSFRNTIDRRAIREDEKLIKLGQHASLACLYAFDHPYQQQLLAKIYERFGHLEGFEREEAIEDALYDAFGATQDVSYDGGGRMVLPPSFRKLAGIEDLAFFVGGAETFQIWNPEIYRASPNAKPRILALLDQQLADRGGKA